MDGFDAGGEKGRRRSWVDDAMLARMLLRAGFRSRFELAVA